MTEANYYDRHACRRSLARAVRPVLNNSSMSQSSAGRQSLSSVDRPVAFNSSRYATLILLTVPFAAAGGVMALPVAGLNMSGSALVGFGALFGVSIQNSVILVTRIRELRREGKVMLVAIKEGATSRVRPMVMTALMALLGLLPMALSNGVGAETARPFAVVIIGGLITGTVLTLFILPLLYPVFEHEPKHLPHPEVETA